MDLEACYLKQQPPICLKLLRVKLTQNLFSIVLKYVSFSEDFRRLALILYVIIGYNKLAGEVYSSPLPGKEKCLVNEARESVLRDEKLNILLFAQSRKCNLKLFILHQPLLAATVSSAKSLEAITAQAHERAKDKPPPVTDLEIFALRYPIFYLLLGLL